MVVQLPPIHDIGTPAPRAIVRGGAGVAFHRRGRSSLKTISPLSPRGGKSAPNLAENSKPKDPPPFKATFDRPVTVCEPQAAALVLQATHIRCRKAAVWMCPLISKCRMFCIELVTRCGFRTKRNPCDFQTKPEPFSRKRLSALAVSMWGTCDGAGCPRPLGGP